jgi:hypothetical protein
MVERTNQLERGGLKKLEGLETWENTARLYKGECDTGRWIYNW